MAGTRPTARHARFRFSSCLILCRRSQVVNSLLQTSGHVRPGVPARVAAVGIDRRRGYPRATSPSRPTGHLAWYFRDRELEAGVRFLAWLSQPPAPAPSARARRCQGSATWANRYDIATMMHRPRRRRGRQWSSCRALARSRDGASVSDPGAPAGLPASVPSSTAPQLDGRRPGARSAATVRRARLTGQVA